MIGQEMLAMDLGATVCSPAGKAIVPSLWALWEKSVRRTQLIVIFVVFDFLLILCAWQGLD